MGALTIRTGGSPDGLRIEITAELWRPRTSLPGPRKSRGPFERACPIGSGGASAHSVRRARSVRLPTRAVAVKVTRVAAATQSPLTTVSVTQSANVLWPICLLCILVGVLGRWVFFLGHRIIFGRRRIIVYWRRIVIR